MSSMAKVLAAAVIALLNFGCGKPACKPGEVYSITAGTARPGTYMVCKVLVIDEHGIWISLFKDQFDHRPTLEEASSQTAWVPMVQKPELWEKNEPRLVNVVPPTQAELDHLEKTRPEVLKLFHLK